MAIMIPPGADPIYDDSANIIGYYPAPANTPAAAPVSSSVDKLTTQILASSNPTQWSGEGFGSAQANAADMAKVLASAGISDVSELGVREVVRQGDPIYDDSANIVDFTPPQVVTEYFNERTGQAVNPEYARAGGNIFSGTFAGKGSTGYGVNFDAQGNPQFFTQYGGSTSTDLTPLIVAASLFGAPYLSSALAGAAPSALAAGSATNAAATGALLGGGGAAVSGGDVLKGALLGGLGGYASNALSGAMAPTDLGMNSNLTMAQIESGLGTPGYGYGAQAAASGLFDPAMIGAGAYLGSPSVTSPSGSGAWLGENVPSGIPEWDEAFLNAGGTFDPAYFSTGPMTEEELGKAFEEYMANAGYNPIPQASYGATESTQGVGGSPANASVAGSGLSSSQISNLIKAGLGLAGTKAVGGMTAGGGGAGALPTQGVPQYGPDYYNAVQQYYNTYMPEMPRDVATPLQQWYESKYGA